MIRSGDAYKPFPPEIVRDSDAEDSDDDIRFSDLRPGQPSLPVPIPQSPLMRGAASAARVAISDEEGFAGALPQPEPFLPRGRYVEATRQPNPPRHVRIDLEPEPPTPQSARIDLAPENPTAQPNLDGVEQREVASFLRGSSGARCKIELNEEKARRAQQLFYETKVHIFAHLRDRGAVAGRNINQIQLSINYTRQEAIITDIETEDEIETVDLSRLPENETGDAIRRLIDDTIQADKDYIPVKEHQLRTFHPLNHGPIKGEHLFRLNPGIGATMQDFIKQDMKAIMTREVGEGEEGPSQADYIAVSKRVATIELYEHLLKAALIALITQEETNLKERKEARAPEREIRQIEADIYQLQERLGEFENIRKEALYYIATQQAYINDGPEDHLFKAQEIAKGMKSYLLDVKQVHVYRSLMDPGSWYSGRKGPTTEHERFAVGIGALSIPAENRNTFNDYAKREKLSVDSTTGIGHMLLYESLKAHDTGEDAIYHQPLLRFLQEGIQNEAINTALGDRVNAIGTAVTELHQEIDGISEEGNALDQAIALTKAKKEQANR